jgi:hypothetical protein
VKRPAEVERLISLANNADHLGKLSLIHGFFAKSDWKNFWRL